MDGQRFDQLTKAMSGCSRRSILKAAAGTAIGGALAAAGIVSANAGPAPRKDGRTCKTGPDCASGVCTPSSGHGPGHCGSPSCVNLGWKDSKVSWACPGSYRLPNADEWAAVEACVTAADAAMFTPINDVGVSVGGCGCPGDPTWCTLSSIETIRIGRACGDKFQLHVCLAG